MNRIAEQFFAVTGISRRKVLLLAVAGVLGGVANGGLLAIVAENLRHGHGEPQAHALLLFLIATGVYVVLQRISQNETARMTEQTAANMRLLLAEVLLNASSRGNERIDHHVKRLVLSRDTALVAAALPNIVALLCSLATVICAMIYLCWLSLIAGAVVCAVIALAVVAYQASIKRTDERVRAANVENDRAFGFIDDLLHGHKELKLDRVWQREFKHNDLMPAIRRAGDLLGMVRAVQQDISLIGVGAFLLLLGGVTFLAPKLGVDAAIVVKTMLVLLFIQTHIYGVVQRLPGLREMQHSAQRISELLRELNSDTDLGTQGDGEGEAELRPWRQLSLRNLYYTYTPAADPAVHHLCDVNLRVARGQTVFIVGGNGSGKTTLAKLLVGLYRPLQGEIRLGDVVIGDANRSLYRNQFNAVFSDVHLFRRSMAGVLTDKTSDVHAALAQMSIELAVSPDNRLDVKPFSQGQKKRLASALALASEKPLYLFDEWTADQDPEFKAYFYEQFLPKLKADGKTVFVVTHDDRYFHRADLIVRMDARRIASIETIQPGNAERRLDASALL